MATLPPLHVPVEIITNLLDGGSERTARRRYVRSLVAADPVFDMTTRVCETHTQAFTHACAKVYARRRLIEKYGLHERWDRRWLKSAIADDIPTDLHELAFEPYLASQCDDEQARVWVPLAQSYAIIGAYAQTELGCGSNVQGMETTATFDADADELVLHSPTLTSRKWWPGGLGHTASHAIVFARLIVPGARREPAPNGSKAHGTPVASTAGPAVDYGVHAFLVQLRSSDDHSMMPGVYVGDIGPKFGFNAMDNGFLQLTHVRIPRRQMLMRFAQLARDGTYVRSGHDKAAYMGMVFIRCAIVSGAGRVLGKAATIATRYSHVRQQFEMKPTVHPDVDTGIVGDRVVSARATSDPGTARVARAPCFSFAPGQQQTRYNSTSIIEYPLVHRRLLPQLATSYALFFTGNAMLLQYLAFEEGMKAGRFDSVAELHASSAALKSMCTTLAADGIEVCRRACGGHGYSSHAGLGELFASYVAVCTAEGDNFLMLLQTARFLLKQWQSAISGGSLASSTAYLGGMARGETGRIDAETCDAWLAWNEAGGTTARDPLLEALQLHAGIMTRRAADAAATVLASPAGEGPDGFVTMFGTVQNELYTAAVAHSIVLMASAFREAIVSAMSARVEVAAILRWVYFLFGSMHASNCRAALLEEGILSAASARALGSAVQTAMTVVLPYTIPLTDAFDFSDFELASSLGRADGRVYEAIVASAEKYGIKESEARPAIAAFIRPLMHSGRVSIRAAAGSAESSVIKQATAKL